MKQLLTAFLVSFSLGLTAQNVMAKAELEAENVDEVRVDGSFVDVYVKKGDRVYFSVIIFMK